MRPSAIAGALVVCSIALLSLGVLPILLGGLDEAGRLSKAGIGRAAMLELFGLALGAGVGGSWMARGGMQLKAAAVAAGLVLAHVVTAFAETSATVMLTRAVAGVLCGLLFGAGNAIIVRSNDPGRLTGILVGASVLPQIALASLLPVAVIPRLGIQWAFYALAACTLVAVPFAGTLSIAGEGQAQDEGTRAPLALDWPFKLFAGSIVLQSSGLGAAWTYLERLANQHGFGVSVVGLALASTLACQVAAAWASAWICPKVSRRLALTGLMAAQTGFIVLGILTRSPSIFIVAACLFGGAAAAMQAFQVAETVARDATRRTAALVGPTILFGNGLGPLLASFATTTTDVVGGSWAAAAMTAGAALLYLASTAGRTCVVSSSLGAGPLQG